MDIVSIVAQDIGISAAPLRGSGPPTIEPNGTSTNSSSTTEPPTILFMVSVAIILGTVILATIIGNVFVIAAIVIERNLQTVSNYLVLSLGVADLMVACLVMPLAAVAEVSQQWPLGAVLCDMWTSCDVLCCTASILHLLAIALDRYRTVSNVDYIRRRSSNHVMFMIAVVWGVAVVVSLAPTFGWKDPNFQKRIEIEKLCLVSQDVLYQIFATFSSFYVPLILILLLYWRIWQVARRRIRNRPGSKVPMSVSKSPSAMSSVQSATMEVSVIASYDQSPNSNSGETPGINGDATDLSPTPNDLSPPVQQLLIPQRGATKKTNNHHPHHPHHHKESIEAKRERKAAKTLAIITGVFVICWLPFFVTVLVMTLCQSCQVVGTIFSLFLWLGYINSMLNPIIYTLFSPDFRNAFKKILFGKAVMYRPKR